MAQLPMLVSFLRVLIYISTPAQVYKSKSTFLCSFKKHTPARKHLPNLRIGSTAFTYTDQELNLIIALVPAPKDTSKRTLSTTIRAYRT
jgi:hypothetical protein